jgi:deoxyadenosine/deoxycytidine kinase
LRQLLEDIFITKTNNIADGTVKIHEFSIYDIYDKLGINLFDSPSDISELKVLKL